MWQNGNEKPCVNSQQSTYQSTHFFSTTKIFGRNTPFSAHLRNCLTFSALHSKTNISHPSFHLTPCERWPFAPRNMPDRTKVRRLPQLETCPMAKPTGCFDDEMGKKRRFHTLVHQKYQTNFFTKIPNKPGFSSQSNFNKLHSFDLKERTYRKNNYLCTKTTTRYFKQHCGSTPKHYLQQVLPVPTPSSKNKHTNNLNRS